MIKKIFSGQINSINLAALLVALSSLVSRFLGVFRDRILAGEFGADRTLDIYYLSFRVPDLVFNLLVLGALSAGFIPIFSSLLDKKLTTGRDIFLKNNKAWRLANIVLNYLGVILFFLVVLGIVFAPEFIRLLAPGFSAGDQKIAVNVTRIMFLSPFLLGLSSVFGGILQSFKRFFVYSLSPIFYNLGIIVGALYFSPLWGVCGLAWGVVLGAFMHLFIQLAMSYSLGFRYKWIWNFRDKYFRKIALMMIPRTMSLAITQINLLVFTIIASTLEPGSITVFNFANNLQFFPISIFGISFAIAAFPAFSRIAFDKKKLIKHFSLVFRQILFFITPATIILLALRAQIIRVVFGLGHFNWHDTVMTINTLGFFSLSLFAQATIPLLTRVFYARHDSKTPFYAGLAAILVNIILSLYLPNKTICQGLFSAGLASGSCEPLGVSGLALAFSVSSIVNFIILWLALRFELGDLDEKKVLVSAIKFSAGAIFAGAGIQISKQLIWPYIDMTKTIGVFVQGLAAGLMGLLVYVAIGILLHSEELFDFWQSIKRRLPFRKIQTGDQGEARGI